MNSEVYGFIFWAVSFAWMAFWFLWAFCPDEFIREKLGVSYYPSKWWAVALPTYGVAFLFFATISYMGLNLMNTKPLDSKFLLSDESTPTAPFFDGDDHDIPSAHDIPLRLVNKLMYDQ
jgi:phosphatidylinositol glycan class P protein